MATYFIQNKASGHIKIGTSMNADNRLRDLQTSSPDELVLIGVIKKDIEKALHDRFSKFRHRGEWFLPHEDLLEYIQEHLSTAESAKVVKRSGPREPELDSNLTWRALAQRFGARYMDHEDGCGDVEGSIFYSMLEDCNFDEGACQGGADCDGDNCGCQSGVVDSIAQSIALIKPAACFVADEQVRFCLWLDSYTEIQIDKVVDEFASSMFWNMDVLYLEASLVWLNSKGEPEIAMGFFEAKDYNKRRMEELRAAVNRLPNLLDSYKEQDNIVADPGESEIRTEKT